MRRVEAKGGRLLRLEAAAVADLPDAAPQLAAPQLVAERPEALTKWRELIAEQCWGRVAAQADADALEAYCLLYARMVEAENKISELGAVVTTPSGFAMQSPWLSIANACRREMHRIRLGFGALSAARSRIYTAPALSDEEEAAGRYFE